MSSESAPTLDAGEQPRVICPTAKKKNDERVKLVPYNTMENLALKGSFAEEAWRRAGGGGLRRCCSHGQRHSRYSRHSRCPCDQTIGRRCSRRPSSFHRGWGCRVKEAGATPAGAIAAIRCFAARSKIILKKHPATYATKSGSSSSAPVVDRAARRYSRGSMLCLESRSLARTWDCSLTCSVSSPRWTAW